MEKSEVFNASKVVEDYSSSVEELKEITTEITKTASDGRPISEELRSKLNKELDGLKTHYTNLCEKAHKISKDIPENPSIYDLQKIIEEYDKISSELSEIKEILTKFIRVTSKEPKYADAIRPYQDKARDIVEQIDNKAVGKEIVSSDTCKGAKCFTNALDNAMDNKNYADLDEETRDSLENIFKPKVISGLAANKYFLPPDKNHAESDDSAENKVVESEPEPVPVVETKKENTTVEERNADSNKSENQQNQNTISSENKTKEINSNGRPFIPEPHFFELITPSVENFLLLLRHIQIITPRQALGFCKNSRRFTSEKLNLRDMKKWFGEWVEKGFLSAITLPTEKEKVFCLPTNPLAGKNITPEIEKNIIFQLKKIDSHFHLFEKPKPISEPETTSPEAATEEPIKQIVQEEPTKQEELIEEIHAEQIPETEPEQKQEQEPEKSEETVKPEEPEEPEKAEKIAETKEPSNQTEEIDEDKNQEKDHLTTICELINSDKIYCATAYAKATNSPFYKALAYAVDDPDDPKAERDYLSDNIQKLIPITEEEKDFTEPLIVSAAMRTFFSARKEYDNLQQLHEIIRKFESNPKLKDAIYKLYKFKEKHNEGLDSCVSQNNISFDNQLDKLKEEAKDTIEKAAKKSSETTKHERFLKTKGLIFAQNSELIKFLDSIKSGTKDKDFYEKIRNFVSQNFIKEGFSVSTDTLDDDKIWQYIEHFWDEAAKEMTNKKHKPLTGDLRNNIIGRTRDCVMVMIKWILLIEEMPVESDTASEYQNLRQSLILDLQAAEDEIKDSLDQHKNDIKKYAGLKIVERTVADIKESIEENNSIENRKKYFYVDFLKTQHILLDENYLPFLDSFPSDPKSLLPENRILKHAYDTEESSFELRLDYILSNEDYCNDYGSAELILEYLKETKNEVYNQIRSKYQNNKKKKNIEELIKDGKNDAKESAETIKKKFVGDLELADAFGQFDDNSIKDTILSNVNDYWFELACEDSNYEFFHHVLDAYINEIKDNAKNRREEGLLNSLEKFKKEQNNKISAKIADKIEKCIQDQNYTVADWLLAPDRNSEDFEDILEEDFLADFTSNYNDAYFTLASKEKSLVDIIRENKDIRNKGEIFEEIQKMAYCWFPSVAPNDIGKDKLKTLLEHLGFGEEPFITNQNPIKLASEKTSYENYTVKRNKYTVLSQSHPIAAFGSDMCTKEIRIICIPKEKNHDQIAKMIEEININQPILILLNCALSETERKRLAKKSKDDKLGNKLFAVIDKTVMMYMAKKYDENAIKRNKMLMALIMPYAYYQPYDHTSPKIPQEMFRGRDEELNAIIDPKGPNFVYGGRQLGKTALLRQAEREIKRIEGGQAVYIELEEKSDYKKTLEKIVDVLSNDNNENDYKIFNKQDYKPSDDPIQAWENLKKTIKNRLVSNTLSTKNKQQISRLLLILDEADAFVNSWKDVNYKPFDILKKLQNDCDGKFKFVIAGLQNVVKFNRTELLKSNNTLINNLDKEKPIRPLGLRGARELLEIPLHYLGFRFPKNKKGENLLYLILANTNCFPGLIQMYCGNLIETMKKTGGTPPYEINESLISDILNDNKFQAAVKEKFLQTLGLDDEKNGGDSYYMTIALTIALMRHYKDKNKPYYCGYSPEDIKTFCEKLGINKKISDLETDKLKILLRELTDLNILKTTPDKNHYLFTRDNFYTMLGTEKEITDEIEKIDKQWESKKKE